LNFVEEADSSLRGSPTEDDSVKEELKSHAIFGSKIRAFGESATLRESIFVPSMCPLLMGKAAQLQMWLYD